MLSNHTHVHIHPLQLFDPQTNTLNSTYLDYYCIFFFQKGSKFESHASYFMSCIFFFYVIYGIIFIFMSAFPIISFILEGNENVANEIRRMWNSSFIYLLFNMSFINKTHQLISVQLYFGHFSFFLF